VEAEKSAPEITRAAVDLIGRLFAVEKQAKDVAAVERLALRQTQSVLVLAELRHKLLAWKEQLLPKQPMAEAVNYTLSQWEELTVFTSDGAVPIDNNVSEREMKRVVLNRKKSLFVGNPRGGGTAAILASLTSTCRPLEMDPQLYFMQLLMNLPAVAGKRHRRLASRSMETSSRCQVRGFGNTSSRFLKTDSFTVRRELRCAC